MASPHSNRAWRLAAGSVMAWLRASGSHSDAHAVRRLSCLTSLADFGANNTATSAASSHRGHAGSFAGGRSDWQCAGRWPLPRPIQTDAQGAAWSDAESEDEDTGEEADQGLSEDALHAKALARDPRRGAVEAALLARLWPGRGFSAAEKPRLLHLLASSEYQGLLQATGGNQQMLDMLVEATALPAAADRWRWKNADAAQCAAVIEDEWRVLLDREGVYERLMQQAGGAAALERQLLGQLSARDLPPLANPNIRPPAAQRAKAVPTAAATPAATSEQRLSQRLWKQAGAASELDDGDDASAAAPLADQRQPLPPPALVPPFVLSRAAARLCPPRVTSDGKPMPLPHGQNSSSLLDGWQLLMPERWGELHSGPSIIEAVAATERFRTEALLAEAAEAAQQDPGDGTAADQPQTTVTTIRQLYPGAVGPQHLLGTKVEVQRLKLARDWQPMLRPTRHRESFFFNPDAGRNAPTLPPEWGRGPTMAAVDPLVAFDPDAQLLQAPLLDPGWVCMCKGMDKEPALRRARATIRIARRWAPMPQGNGAPGAPGSGRPVLFYITTQAGRDIRTQGKVRQAIKQFYKRGRFVVDGLQKKHDFDAVFVFMTSHYLSTLDNFVLDQIRAKDLVVVQNYPQPVVHPPMKPAPPWSTTPHDFHGRCHRLAPAVKSEELLSGIEAYQPLFRDTPELLRIYETVARRFRDRAHFDLY